MRWWITYSSLQQFQTTYKQQSGEIQSFRGKKIKKKLYIYIYIYILFTVHEVESRLACKRPALFCLSDHLACWQSGQSNRSVSNQSEPCFKKTPQSLGRGCIYDPKLRWWAWPSSEPSSPYILFEHIRNKGQRCRNTPRDAYMCNWLRVCICLWETRLSVCKQSAGWKRNLLTFRPAMNSFVQTLVET